MNLSSMNCIRVIFQIFLPIVSSSYALDFQTNPIIIINQAVVVNNGSLPINIFWYHTAFREGDMLLVYSADGEKEYAHHMIESVTGFYEVPGTNLEHGEYSGEYCVSILSKIGALYKSPSCKSKVEWLYDRKSLFQEFTLRDLIIPGTHQSGAYGNSCNETLEDQSHISRWILCQRKTIKTQLMEGIRYLDLRAGFMYIDGVKKYTVTHGMFRMSWMDDIVDQINDFLDVSRDIVVVSFREFARGFSSEKDHLDFIKYLEESFTRYAHPIGYWTYTLNVFWNEDRRLVLAYDHITFDKSTFLWPGIPQYWANAQTINRLHSYIDTVLHQDLESVGPWALMAVFTHSFTSIVQDMFQGDMSIRHWAERLGKCVPRWFIEDWRYTDANIVAVDFYEASGIVDLAIQLNEQRAKRARYRHVGSLHLSN